jgi:hypothetical protein
MKEQTRISMQITGMEVSSYSIAPKPSGISSKIDYSINLESTINVNPEKKIISVITQVKVDHRDTKTNMATITVVVAFQLENINEVAILRPDMKYDIDTEIDKKLTLLSMNTIRGIMFVYFRGTYLQNIILPIVDDENLTRSKVN